MLQAVTDYVRSIGYITIWSAFYKAGGYYRGGDCRFDLISMQANYFPALPDTPNAGPIERLTENAEICKELGIGFELEIHGGGHVGYTGLKQYLKKGVELNYMNGYHAYYIGGGPRDVNDLYERDAYSQSAYKELHKFIKRTLKVSDILLESDDTSEAE